MDSLLLKLAASLPVGDETRRALIKMAGPPKGRLKEFLDEVGDQKVINPVTKNKVKVRTLSTYEKNTSAYKLFWDEYQRWLKEQEVEPEDPQKAWDNRFSSMFQDIEEVEAWAKETQNHRREKWPPEVVWALRKYTNSYYGEINPALREGIWRKDLENLRGMSLEDPNFPTTNDGFTVAAIIDKLFASPEGKMDTDIVVKRGVGENHPLYRILEGGSLKVGDIFEDPAYQSTTLMKGFGWNESVGFQIKVPKGASAVYVGRPPDDYSDHSPEYEVLLNRGSKLKITGIRKNPDPNSKRKYLIEAEVIVE